MKPALVYDLSRLVTRVLNPTPNGIDRVDILLARHFLTSARYDAAALRFGFGGPRLISPDLAQRTAAQAAAAWDEAAATREAATAFDAVVGWLSAGTMPSAGKLLRPKRIVQFSPHQARRVAAAFLRHALDRGAAPQTAIRKDAFYINSTHFPLEWSGHVRWLDRASSMRPVFFIHDLLPIEHPEWFWKGEPAKHARRLDLLARRGAAAIVTTANVEQGLRHALEQRGRYDLPIFRHALPSDPIFFDAPSQRRPELAEATYFITCGTIEPRKNLMLLLRVWKRLVVSLGARAPKLLVIGKRGWNNADIVETLESPMLRDHVLEISGLSTQSYTTLLAHCCALLAPSFAEGFGLPVAEAKAAGVPIVASEIPAHREQSDGDINFLKPDADADWQAIIENATAERSPRDIDLRLQRIPRARLAEADYLAALDDFLNTLSPSSRR